MRRKRLSAACLFAALTAAMLGVLVWVPVTPWIVLVLVGAIALFTWRCYRSTTPLGWL